MILLFSYNQWVLCTNSIFHIYLNLLFFLFHKHLIQLPNSLNQPFSINIHNEKLTEKVSIHINYPTY